VIRRFRLPLIVAASVAIVVLAATPCWACSCIAVAPEEQAASSSAIFGGVVEEVELAGQGDFGQEVEATFAVDTIYKGQVPARVVVGTAADSAACGVEFEEGGRYTVFASGDEAEGFSTGLCTATTRGDIDPARFGLSPTTVEPPPPPDGPTAAPFLLSVAGVMVAGGFALWLVRRRRARDAVAGGIQ
jgi:hypothetical protein